MSFAENLQRIRKERHLSQEELAEMLDVSRQAVSKWEQGEGYPEAEKLMLLSGKLNVSLDTLMATGIEGTAQTDRATGVITISSPHEHVVAKCRRVASQRFRGGEDVPQYALFGVSDGPSIWGETNVFLAWYATKEQLEKEFAAIRDAIFSAAPTYELKYSAKVERRLFSVKLAKD